jgi:hypothetical protein
MQVNLEGKADAEKRELLKKCAMTTLNSKLVRLLGTCQYGTFSRLSCSAPCHVQRRLDALPACERKLHAKECSEFLVSGCLLIWYCCRTGERREGVLCADGGGCGEQVGPIDAGSQAHRHQKGPMQAATEGPLYLRVTDGDRKRACRKCRQCPGVAHWHCPMYQLACLTGMHAPAGDRWGASRLLPS